MRVFVAAFFAAAVLPAAAASAAGERPSIPAESVTALTRNPEGGRLAVPLPRAEEPDTAPGTAETFVDSWHYYLWRLEQGDSLTDLEYLLTRIKAKYAGAGLKLSAVDRELAAVRTLRKLAAPQPVGGE